MRHISSNYRLLPAYSVLNDQYRFQCGNPCDQFMKMTESAYPPFQLQFDADMGIPSSVKLKELCNGVTHNTNYLSSVTRTQIDIDNDGVDEWVYTFEGGPFGGVPAGIYYVEIIFPGLITLHTETFCHPGSVINSCEPNWMLQWSNSCDEKSLGYYSMNFANKLNLGHIHLIREGEIENITKRKDGFGFETNISTDLRPRYFFEILGNNWLLDSLSYLKLFDIILLSRSENGDIFDLKNIEVTGVGDTTGCIFPIKVSFTKDILVNTKCCNSIYEQAPLPGNCAGMTVTITNDFAICSGDEVILEATIIGGDSPFILVWSTGETGTSITVSPTETTTYVVTAIDAFGCVKQDEVEITVIVCDGSFSIGIIADDDDVCVGTDVMLDATITGGVGPFTYLWSTGETTQDITVTPTSTTIYSVQVTDTSNGDVEVETITITVHAIPEPIIASNGCLLTIIQNVLCGFVVYLWEIESAPDVWDPATGTNNGQTYTGETGENYRLKTDCDGCVGYSNEITVICSSACVTNITVLSYDSILEELTVTYVSTMGSESFQTGYLTINESLTPNLGNCAASGNYSFVISVTLTAESDTVVIPFVPNQLPTCVAAIVNINAGECTDNHYEAIS